MHELQHIEEHDSHTMERRRFEAVILAGGLGTRLRTVVSDLPKCMAPVAGKPFLHHVIKHLQNQGVDKFIFSLGYMHEVIEQYLFDTFPLMFYKVVIEDEPLGTGGAIQLACKEATEKDVIVLNGDTLFAVNIKEAGKLHHFHDADCTLALKPMQDFDRYGVVELNSNHSIASFKEKQFYEKGLINGGVYLLNVANFLDKKFPEKFSFEKDYLEKYYAADKMFGIVQDEYFIDIGIPEDFERAQKELK